MVPGGFLERSRSEDKPICGISCFYACLIRIDEVFKLRELSQSIESTVPRNPCPINSNTPNCCEGDSIESYIMWTLGAILSLFIARSFSISLSFSTPLSSEKFTMAPDVPTYPITGIPREVPLRVEVDDFYKSPQYAVRRNLFLLAMAKFQAMDPKEKLSYFKVAGTLKYAYCMASQLK